MYDAEVTIRRSAPLCARRVDGEQRVKEFVENALAAWGIPFPDRLKGAPEEAFAEQLAETGEYRHDETGYSIVVKRC